MEEEGVKDQWPSFSFVQDNASSHTVNCLTIPSNSPDINIIENLWAYVQNQLFEIKEQISSPEDTWQRVQEWPNVPLDFIDDLYLDLLFRMKELLENKGGPI